MSVVSVRVSQELKKKLEEAGIDVSAEVRKHLEEVAWNLELNRRLGRLEKTLKDMPRAPTGSSARSVREDREGH